MRVAYNSMFRKIFNYSWRESVTELQHVLGRPTWEELIASRTANFQGRFCFLPADLPRWCAPFANDLPIISCNLIFHFWAASFYTSVAADLVAKLPNPLGAFRTTSEIFRRFYFKKVGLRPGFTLSPVTSHFVRKQLLSLNTKKAVGLDDISSLFLRDGTECIITPVTHIINISIITETVPAAFKEAKVIPLFRKGSTLDPGNYRPVSILNVLSTW